MKMYRFSIVFLLIFSVQFLHAQKKVNRINHCATATRLQAKLQHSQAFRMRYEQKSKEFSAILARKRNLPAQQRFDGTYYNIPVVFHVLLRNPEAVTDQQLIAQIDTLNKSFRGANDRSGLISGFLPLAAGAKIQFCLAQQSPDNLPTSGIVRHAISAISYDPNNDFMKETALGGADPWNTNQYLNIWICKLDNGILGFASFPNADDSAHQGVVLDTAALPAPQRGQYNQGKSLVHELGHFFNLLHIWGDDSGACTGSDEIDDTPNQGDATYGYFTGIKTDLCSPNAPGYMYQNFMDYSDDESLLIFTKDQVQRMETALSLYRQVLAASSACLPVQALNLDLEVLSNAEIRRICVPSVAVPFKVRNRGETNITAVHYRYKIGSSEWEEATYTGLIQKFQEADIQLPPLATPTGLFSLEIEILDVNGMKDENEANDLGGYAFRYAPSIDFSFLEDVEDGNLSPPGWDIVNPDNGLGWEIYNGPSYSGSHAIRIQNYVNDKIGTADLLRLPQLNLSGLDSSFLSFRLAAATYSSVSGNNAIWDTLEVLVSRDCGQTSTPLYKKWAATLRTVEEPQTEAFIPNQNNWRKDSVDLSAYIGEENLLVYFRNTNGFENNVYLDDIRIRNVIVNPNLKAKGILISPNPTIGLFSVQFYPQPTNLKALQVYDMKGALLQQISVGDGTIANRYDFNLANRPAGVYLVRVVYSDKVLVKKIIKSGN